MKFIINIILSFTLLSLNLSKKINKSEYSNQVFAKINDYLRDEHKKIRSLYENVKNVTENDIFISNGNAFELEMYQIAVNTISELDRLVRDTLQEKQIIKYKSDIDNIKKLFLSTHKILIDKIRMYEIFIENIRKANKFNYEYENRENQKQNFENFY